MIQPYTPADLPAACCLFTGPFEGNVLWPYLDDGGNVTIARGHLVVSDLALRALFPNAPVSDVADSWDYLMSAKPGMAPIFYENGSPMTIRLSWEQSDALFLGNMTERIDVCALQIPGFWDIPGPGQKATIDCYYNTGEIFHEMVAALEAGDYLLAARQSHRIETPDPVTRLPVPGGIQPARNQATYDLIMSISSPDA